MAGGPSVSDSVAGTVPPTGVSTCTGGGSAGDSSPGPQVRGR